MLSYRARVPGDMQRENGDAERGLVLEALAASRTGSTAPAGGLPPHLAPPSEPAIDSPPGRGAA